MTIDDTITISQVLPFAILILEPRSWRNLELFVYKISRLSGSNPVSEPHGQGVIQRLLLSPSLTQSFEGPFLTPHNAVVTLKVIKDFSCDQQLKLQMGSDATTAQSLCGLSLCLSGCFLAKVAAPARARPSRVG